MKRVYICSPYRSYQKDPAERVREIEGNLKLARKGCRIAVERGYMPIAPHLYFPQFLNESTEGDVGIEAGLELLKGCKEVWVLGRRISDGMADEINEAKELGIPVKVMERPETASERLMKFIKERA